MSSLAVRDAFEAAFSAAFPTVPVVPIEAVQVDVPKAGGKLTDFAGMLYFGNETPVFLGNTCWRETGTLNVVLFTVSGRGVRAAVQLADDVRNMFAGKDLQVTPPGVRLGLGSASPLTAYMGRAGVPTGAYFTAMVAVDYEFDFKRN